MDDNALDRTIDEVARGMTAGDMRRDFRASVIGRLDTRQPRWVLPALGSLAAVTAIVVLAAIIGRHPGAPPATAGSTTEAALLPARPIPFAAVVRGRGPETPTPERRVVPVRESPVAALAPAALEMPSLALTTLGRGESIRIEELEPIAPITVAPIGEPEGERK